MKTKYYLNGKKVSRKALESQFGKDRIDRITREAKDAFRQDPLEQLDFFMGSAGMLTVEFE